MQRRPELQKIKHYILEGNVLAANERQKENQKVVHHLQSLQQQVDELQNISAQTDIDKLRSLLLVAQTNIEDAKHGWELANQALCQREQ